MDQINEFKKLNKIIEGDGLEIRERNKLDLGVRLGLAARKIAYGERLVCEGPVYQSMQMDDRKIRISFRSIGGGLIAKNKFGFLRGFAIAGADKQFHWANAYIEGDAVVVFSPAVQQPVAVRYAWADNPGPLDLYNVEGLPAFPFRTDDWPLFTTGKVYLYDENGF